MIIIQIRISVSDQASHNQRSSGDSTSL